MKRCSDSHKEINVYFVIHHNDLILMILQNSLVAALKVIVQLIIYNFIKWDDRKVKIWEIKEVFKKRWKESEQKRNSVKTPLHYFYPCNSPKLNQYLGLFVTFILHLWYWVQPFPQCRRFDLVRCLVKDNPLPLHKSDNISESLKLFTD